MLLKPFTCYGVGVLTTALAVSMGCGHWGVICYALGLISALVLAYSALRCKSLARLAIKLLTLVVGEPLRTPARPSASKREIRDSGFFDIKKSVALGLKGLGCDAERARWAAAQAVKTLPEGSEDQVLRLAISMASSR